MDNKQEGVGTQAHYENCAIQPIDYITANNMSFLEGNIIKYVTRYKAKNGLEDLLKAQQYLIWLMNEVAQQEKADENVIGKMFPCKEDESPMECAERLSAAEVKNVTGQFVKGTNIPKINPHFYQGGMENAT